MTAPKETRVGDSTDPSQLPLKEPTPRRSSKRPVVPIAITFAVVLIVLSGAFLLRRALADTNKITLASQAKPVTVVEGRASTYRPSRRYIATLQPWLEAKVGPQLVSGYVDTVLFRPGAVVRRGEVLATLDCRNASATSKSVAMMARAIESKQAAVAHEAARMSNMLDGGFISPNEVERKKAESASEEAELLSARAKLVGSSLEVNDCVLRAPFDGEISARMIDPGAFVRPGTSIMGLVDRTTVRVTTDVPEVDFEIVAPGTPVKVFVIATGQTFTGPILRRSPAADAGTRTVHFELDLADPKKNIPVGTTAELTVEVGEPIPATELPLVAASIRGTKANVLVLEGEIVKKRSVPVLGERNGMLYVDTTALSPGSRVVTEGRSSLNDGDHVAAKLAVVAPSPPTTGSAAAAKEPGK